MSTHQSFKRPPKPTQEERIALLGAADRIPLSDLSPWEIDEYLDEVDRRHKGGQ